MADKIKKSDLFDDNLFPTKEIEGFNVQLEAMSMSFDKLIEQKMKIAQGVNFIDSKSILTVNKAMQEGNKLLIAQEKLKQQEIKTSEGSRKQDEAKVKNDERKAKAAAAAASAYQRLSKQLVDQKKAVKDLLASEKELSDADKQLIKDTQDLDHRLKAIDKTLGDNQRNVGNYKDSIREALNESTLFNTGIGRLIIGLKTLGTKLKESGDNSKSFSDKLKVGLAGGVAIAVVALKELAEVNASVSNFFGNISAQIGGFLTGGFDGAEAMKEFRKALIGSYEELRRLSSALQQVTLDENDFKEISADVTIGFKERNEALDKSLVLGRERAKLAKDIAKLELDVINKEVAANSIGLREASKELLDKQSDAQSKYNATLDQEGDLIRQNAEIIRQRNLDEAVAAVELLRSKKLSFNEQEKQLEMQLSDEKKQLEERRKIASQLLKVQNDTISEEIKLFKQKTKIQFDEQKLLNETDAIKLANQLKSIKQINEEGKLVGIGEQAISELAKIVKEYQENRIKNGESIKKLDEEEIKRLQKIAEIEKEIGILKLQDNAGDLQKVIDKRTEAFEKGTEKILNKGELFNRKLSKQRELDFDYIIANLEAERLAKEDLLNAQAEADRTRIGNSVYDEKIKAEEIKKINAKLNIDLQNLADETFKKEHDLNEKKIKEDKEISIKQIELAIQGTQKILSAVDEGLNQRQERNNEAIDQEISQRERAIEEQQSLAERGLANTLAFEKEALAKSELARKQEAERQRRQDEAIKLADLFLSNLNSKVEKGKPFLQASGEAFAETFAAKGISSVIAGSFFEGTEKVEDDLKGNKIHNGRDGYLIAADGKERILTGEQNRLIGDMSNDDLASLAYQSRLNDVNVGGFAKNVSDSVMLYQLSGVKSGINKLISVVENRPHEHLAVDSFGNIIKTIYKNGEKTATTFMNKNRRKSL